MRQKRRGRSAIVRPMLPPTGGTEPEDPPTPADVFSSGKGTEADPSLLEKGDLSQYDVIIMPDVHPSTPEERDL